MFDDEILSPLFTQVTGYQILLDLLYENEKFVDILRIYDTLVASGRLHKNKYIDVIVLASLYRLVCHNEFFYWFQVIHKCLNDTILVEIFQNTAESFEKAYDIWSRISEVGNKVQFRKSRTFVAGLALNQNRPDLALSVLEGETTYVTMRHIKLLAWARMSQFDLVFDMFRKLFKQYDENRKLKPLTCIVVVSFLLRLSKFRINIMN